MDRLATTRHRHGSFTTPVQVGMWIYAVACVLHTTRVDIGYVAAAAVLTAVAAPVATFLYRDGHKPSAWYALVAGVAAGGWLFYSRAVTPPHAVVAHGFWWLVLGIVVLGWPYGVLRRHQRKQRTAEYVKAEQVRRQERAVEALDDWTKILVRSGLPLVTINGTPTEPRPGVIEFTGSLPEDGSVQFRDVKGAEAKLTLQASHVLKQRQRVKIRPGAVTVSEIEDDASTVKFTIRLRNVIEDDLEWEDDGDEPASIAQPLLIGLFENAMNLLLSMTGAHGVIVGATGSGKSVVLNCIIAKLLKCIDAVIWIAAADKLWQLIDPWMAPWYRGEMEYPPFDWVAGERQDEILRWLAGLYRAIKVRSTLPHKRGKLVLSKHRPAIVAFLEEAASTYRSQDTIKVVTGEYMTATQLVREIKRLGRSEHVYLWELNQGALYTIAGADGPMIARNTTSRICLNTMSEYDGRETIGAKMGIDTTTLKHHAMYVRTNIESPQPALLGKAFSLYDDDVIYQLMLRRYRAGLLSALDAETERGLGKDYAERWHPERCYEVLEQRRRHVAELDEELVTVAANRGDYDTTMAAAAHVGGAGPEQTGGSTMTQQRDTTPTGPNGGGSGGGDGGSEIRSRPGGGGLSGLFGQVPDFAAAVKHALADRGIDLDAEDDADVPAGTEDEPPARTATPAAVGDQARVDDQFAQITDEMAAEWDLMKAATGDQPVPEPLAALLKAFYSDPREFISSAELGKAVGMDSAALGRALAKAVPNLTSVRRRRPEYPDNPHPTRGFFMDRLRDAAVAASRGEELPTDDAADDGDE
jgi:hypothetical protein